MTDKKQETIFYDKDKQAHIVKNQDGTVEGSVFGMKMKLNEDGATVVNMDVVKCFGIRDLQNVVEYSITRNGDVIRHSFLYGNGASGNIAFDISGKIVDFHLSGNGDNNKVSVSITKEGEVMIGSGGD